MTQAERTRLAGVLGMLGSEHAGERAAAALAADKLVRGRGLSWGELLEQSAVSPLRAEPPPGVDDLALCGRALDRLSSWEQEFVLGCAQRRGGLSQKQAAVLAKIAAKVRTT